MEVQSSITTATSVPSLIPVVLPPQTTARFREEHERAAIDAEGNAAINREAQGLARHERLSIDLPTVEEALHFKISASLAGRVMAFPGDVVHDGSEATARCARQMLRETLLGAAKYYAPQGSRQLSIAVAREVLRENGEELESQSVDHSTGDAMLGVIVSLVTTAADEHSRRTLLALVHHFASEREASELLWLTRLNHAVKPSAKLGDDVILKNIPLLKHPGTGRQAYDGYCHWMRHPERVGTKRLRHHAFYELLGIVTTETKAERGVSYYFVAMLDVIGMMQRLLSRFVTLFEEYKHGEDVPPSSPAGFEHEDPPHPLPTIGPGAGVEKMNGKPEAEGSGAAEALLSDEEEDEGDFRFDDSLLSLQVRVSMIRAAICAVSCLSMIRVSNNFAWVPMIRVSVIRAAMMIRAASSLFKDS